MLALRSFKKSYMVQEYKKSCYPVTFIVSYGEKLGNRIEKYILLLFQNIIYITKYLVTLFMIHDYIGFSCEVL